MWGTTYAHYIRDDPHTPVPILTSQNLIIPPPVPNITTARVSAVPRTKTGKVTTCLVRAYQFLRHVTFYIAHNIR